ncbi:cellulose biosynthesis cyclic di-GMP-binding regulatory protein BcsB [Promethearchaeum syntrophicum]|uniref:Cellulose biosynthesis cyclic di-GMP-binding regulatory protein BcsB n=1 Tax=Promethearchaeum syntrophicum TaxID=2594042 RepID=A0A5B9DF34_9ARCH|nr:cellulose biosynthesis cyclic di-GMP-binding regulatory protein BcsB [Candidatus Prometheoarchaeum syntrophicum]
MKNKKLKNHLLLYIFVSGILISLIILPNFIGNSKALEIETPADSYIENRTDFSKLMVMDPNFSFEPSYSPWIMEEDGDVSDINQYLENDQANNIVIGENYEFSNVSGIPDSTNWTAIHNPAFPAYPEWPYNSLQDSYGMDEFGCWANHSWREGPRQLPSVLWVQNFTMPNNMSDYQITSANVSALINASVNSNIDVDPNVYSGETQTTQGFVYDHVRFYVSIADPLLENIYEIAYYQSSELGYYVDAVTNTLEIEKYMNMVLEDNIKFYLSSVFSHDWENFTVILGMDIFCEDNAGTDYDYWNNLRIKNVNFTFTYEKKIDQLTSASWDQTGNKIDNGEYELGDVGFFIINNASLYFDYKISPLWPTSSINSEIRVYVNQVLLSKTIKLTEFSSTFQRENFDISPTLIDETENITLKLQLFVADNFHLNENVTVTFDNVNLTTSFTVVERNIPIPTVLESIPDFVFYIMGFIIVGLITSFVAYQQYFKYPKIIREIRSLGKAIRKGKAAEKVLSVKISDDLFVQDYIAKAKGSVTSINETNLKGRGVRESVQKSITKGDVKKELKVEEALLKEKEIITPKISKEVKIPEISKKPSSLEENLELPKAELPKKVIITQKIEKLKPDQFVKPHNIEESDLNPISMRQKPKKIRYLRKPKVEDLPKNKTDEK